MSDDRTDRFGTDIALLVVDAQTAFDDPRWGPRNNPAADANIEALVELFTATGRPRVLVQHSSTNPDGRFHPSQPGHRFKDYLQHVVPDLLVTKSVHSSFHGTPDLHAWLTEQGVRALVVTGITTNHCCETTARVGGDLGYDVWFALDATHTFDQVGPDGALMTADEAARATATNLHGKFATVVSTAEIVSMLGPGAVSPSGRHPGRGRR